VRNSEYWNSLRRAATGSRNGGRRMVRPGSPPADKPCRAIGAGRMDLAATALRELGRPGACPAVIHLTAHEAEAWCRWAAAVCRAKPNGNTPPFTPAISTGQPGLGMDTSAFEPYPGFSPDPYAEYAEPFFHTTAACAGALSPLASACATRATRNYYERNATTYLSASAVVGPARFSNALQDEQGTKRCRWSAACCARVPRRGWRPARPIAGDCRHRERSRLHQQTVPAPRARSARQSERKAVAPEPRRRLIVSFCGDKGIADAEGDARRTPA